MLAMVLSSSQLPINPTYQQGLSVKIYEPGALLGTSQQTHTGLHLFCVHYISQGNDLTPFCISSLLLKLDTEENLQHCQQISEACQ